MAGLAQFAGWLATQVFDVVGSVAGQAAADSGAYSDTVDLQVGKVVFHDVPASMRTELWLSQLQRKSARGPAVMAEYRDSLFEKLAPEVLGEIEKDVHRTFPNHPRLSTEEGQRAMLNVLRAYALADPEIGYTQGMNFLAGLLLTYLPTEAEAYCALSLLMRQRGLREMYLPDMSLLQIRLWQLSKLLPPRLAAHLEAHAVLPVLYASSWLITCFASDFPFHFAARVMDVLLTGQHVASPVLKIAVALVTSCQHDLLNMHDFEEMVQYLRRDVPRWPKRALQDLLTDALSKPWSARQLKVLEQINGAETVMDAVARVNKLVQQPTVEAAEVAAVLEQVGSSATAGGEAGTAAQPAQQHAEPSPRTVARSLSNSFRRPPALPPPPRGRADAVQWDAWQAPDRLASVGTQQVRIDKSIGDVDLLDLDPQLSKALLAYPHCDPPTTAPSFAPFQAAQPGGSSAPAQAQASHGAAAAGGGQTAAQQAQQAQQDGLEPAGSSTAAQQAAGAAGLSPRSPADAADAQHKWEAFSAHSNRCLLSAPSPFDSPAPAPAPMRAPPRPLQMSATFDVAQLTALRQKAAAAAAGAAGGQRGTGQPSQPQQPQQQQSAPTPALGGSLVGSYGSFQLAEQPSALPLVLPSGQAKAAGSSGGSDGGQASGSTPRKGFLGLFHRSVTPEQQASGGQAGSAAGSDLIQEVPSSHGSSLAAVLSQLGLSGPGSSGAAHGSVSAGPSQRRLQHSGGGDEFGSFKTAQGSIQEGSAQSSGALDAARPPEGVPSWHSAASCGTSQQAAGGGRPQDSCALASTASSSLPSAQQQPGVPGGSADGAEAMAAAAAAGVPARRLSSAAADRRVSSLQEEHLHGFRSSGQEQASRAAAAGQRTTEP